MFGGEDEKRGELDGWTLREGDISDAESPPKIDRDSRHGVRAARRAASRFVSAGFFAVLHSYSTTAENSVCLGMAVQCGYGRWQGEWGLEGQVYDRKQAGKRNLGAYAAATFNAS